jgi:hypothetical protein
MVAKPAEVSSGIFAKLGVTLILILKTRFVFWHFSSSVNG